MSDETVASLGFAVNSDPAKQAADVLNNQLVPAAQNAGKAADGLNQSLDKTAPVVGKLDAVAKQLGVTVDQLKAGIAGAKDGVVNLKTGLDGLGTSTQKTGDMFADMAKSIANANQQFVKTGSETQAMGSAINAAIGKSVVSFSDMTKGVATANGAIAAMPAVLDKAAAAHGGLSGQSQALAHSVRSLGEQFASGQISMMSFTQQLGHLSYAMSGEGGITGAIGGLARMIGPGGLIVGGVVATTAAILGLQHAMASAALEVQATKDRFEALGGVKLGDDYSASLEKLRKTLGVTREDLQPTYEAMLKLVDLHANDGVSASIAPWSKYLDAAKFSADKLTDSIAAVFQGLRLGGLRTSDAVAGVGKFFDDLIKKQELTGASLRQLQDISPQFAKALAKALTDGRQSASELAAALDTVPIPIQQVIGVLPGLKQSSDAAFKSLQDNPRTAGEAIDRLGISLANLARGNEAAAQGQAQASIFTVMLTQIDHAVVGLTQLNATGTEQLRQFNESAIQYLGLREATSALGSSLAQADADIARFAQNANASFASIVQSYGAALTAIGQVAAAVANGSALSGGGGNASGLSGGGNPYNTDPLGNVNGGNGGLPHFASGTDNAPGGPALINEKGGEIVNLPSGSQVIPHDLSMQMVNNLSPGAPPTSGIPAASLLGGGVSGAPILGDSAHQTDILTSRLNASLKDQTSALKDSTAAGATRIVDAINSCCGQLVTAINTVDGDIKNIQLSAANSNVSSGGSSFSSGTAASGGLGTYGNSNAPYWQQPNYTSMLPGVVRGGGLGNQSDGLFGSPYKTNDFNSPLSAPGPYISAGNGYAGSLSGSSSAGYTSAGSGSSGSTAGGPGYDSDYNLRPATQQERNVIEAQTNAWRDSQKYSGGIISPSSISDYGAFATGGKFIVGGDGGTDTTNALLHLTRGETVEIKPAGVVADSVSVPSVASSAAPSAAPAQAAAPVTNKYVTIYVQQGVQADTFIKSRAQIARAA
ncbi:hypothetical protein [Bradyrhizobium sp. 6(2017)]|uniref:hypothetical protein n=1 Tax=Bradyrhizobium sp. 6(2017) TaxID=1197460 RepID=UPI0013E10FD5|nr:hypothetical protein [Bradyrhizobium sp. 6(2017)]QIG91981.1 hypothetical protein G6P99_05335 [Bradyrhizobium sp. 6(2017)]